MAFVTLKLDQETYDTLDQPVSTAAKRAVFEYLEDKKKCPPLAAFSAKPVHQIAVSLNPQELAKLDAARAANPGVAVSRSGFFAALLLASFAKPSPKRPKANAQVVKAAAQAKELLNIKSLRSRPEQVALLTDMLLHYQGEGVLFAEAGTGVGKGLACVATAYDLVRAGQGAVIVSAPTYTVLRQLLRETKRLMQKHGEQPVRLVLGKREFVSERALMNLMHDVDDEPWQAGGAVRKWVQDQKMRVVDPVNLPWTRESLAEASPAPMPMTEVVLTDDVDDMNDGGAAAYRAQMNELAAFRGIVLCTHAMLCYDTITRRRSTYDARLEDSDYEAKRNAALKRHTVPAPRFIYDNEIRIQAEKTGTGLLPDYRWLVIDEAHAFAEAMRSASSREVSLWKLVVTLKQSGAKANLSAVERHYRALTELSLESGKSTIPINTTLTGYAPQCFEHLQGLLTATKRAVNTIPKHSKNAGVRAAANAARNMLDTLKHILSASKRNEPGSRIFVDFTPVRRYPRICAARYSVAPLLDYLWRRPQAAALLSATLYTLTARGFTNPAYMRHLLSVPAGRLRTVPSRIPPWLTQGVELWTPEPIKLAARSWLQPPRASQTRDMSEQSVSRLEGVWYKELAALVTRIGMTARGGTLVLCTSFADLDGLLKQLQGTALETRLIPSPTERKALGTLSFEPLKQRFMQMGRENAKPVWIATGQAWTGLDLSLQDVPADKDWLLTDLVVTKLPFAKRPNDGNSAKPGLDQLQVINEAIIRLRQGIGRLIRREGLKHRRIHILDGGLWNRTGGLQQFHSLLKMYTTSKTWKYK